MVYPAFHVRYDDIDGKYARRSDRQSPPAPKDRQEPPGTLPGSCLKLELDVYLVRLATIMESTEAKEGPSIRYLPHLLQAQVFRVLP